MGQEEVGETLRKKQVAEADHANGYRTDVPNDLCYRNLHTTSSRTHRTVLRIKKGVKGF